MGLLSKLGLVRNQWRPREGLVYRSDWSHSSSHFGKSIDVKIIFDGKERTGTFKVYKDACELRLLDSPNKRLTTSVSNVDFEKTDKTINTYATAGQNGWAGRSITYVAKIKDKSQVKFSIIKDKRKRIQTPSDMYWNGKSWVDKRYD
jgi:hypothetical protein